MSYRKWALFCAVTALGAPLAANAALVSYEATGTITHSFGGLLDGIPPAIALARVGESFTLFWTVNTATPPNTDPVGVSAQYSGAITALSAQVGGATVNFDLSAGTNSVSIDAGYLEIPASRTYETGYIINAVAVGSYDVILDDSLSNQVQQTYYSSSSLDNGPLPVTAASFHQVEFLQRGFGGGPVIINLDTIVPTPLPAGGWLLLSGLGLLAFGILRTPPASPISQRA